jgi:hypothetical protein
MIYYILMPVPGVEFEVCSGAGKENFPPAAPSAPTVISSRHWRVVGQRNGTVDPMLGKQFAQRMTAKEIQLMSGPGGGPCQPHQMQVAASDGGFENAVGNKMDLGAHETCLHPHLFKFCFTCNSATRDLSLPRRR